MEKYYDTREAAEAAIVPVAGAGDALRAKAGDHLAAERESFERCDTDGFLTQWAHACNADKARMEAELADNGGVAVFPVLVDLETDEIVGEKVFVFANKFNYGTRTVFLVERDGGTEWVNAAYRKDATYTKKGLKKAYVIAEAFIGHKDNDPFNKLPVERGMPAGPIHYHAIRKPATYNWKEEAA